MTERVPIIDQYDDIHAHLTRLRDEAVPRCPLSPNVRLDDCLQTAIRCSPTCPKYDLWTGPEAPPAIAVNDDVAQLRSILNRHGFVVKEPPGGGDLGGC